MTMFDKDGNRIVLKPEDEKEDVKELDIEDVEKESR